MENVHILAVAGTVSRLLVYPGDFPAPVPPAAASNRSRPGSLRTNRRSTMTPGNEAYKQSLRGPGPKPARLRGKESCYCVVISQTRARRQQGSATADGPTKSDQIAPRTEQFIGSVGVQEHGALCRRSCSSSSAMIGVVKSSGLGQLFPVNVSCSSGQSALGADCVIRS